MMAVVDVRAGKICLVLEAMLRNWISFVRWWGTMDGFLAVECMIRTVL